jgi:hypothetical protein
MSEKYVTSAAAGSRGAGRLKVARTPSPVHTGPGMSLSLRCVSGDRPKPPSHYVDCFDY